MIKCILVVRPKLWCWLFSRLASEGDFQRVDNRWTMLLRRVREGIDKALTVVELEAAVELEVGLGKAGSWRQACRLWWMSSADGCRA